MLLELIIVLAEVDPSSPIRVSYLALFGSQTIDEPALKLLY